MNTSPTPTIRILVAENPKKPGSKAYARFQLYKEGMTVAAFLRSGGTRSDLHWDIDKKYIDIASGTATNGSAKQPTGERAAVLKRIQALANKTLENGCTEEEAMSAAIKMGELMEKYGIESTEAELKSETCIAGVHGGERLRAHESQWVATQLALYCYCKVWRQDGKIYFFGIPSDVEIATYLMRVIEGAMNRSYKDFKASPGFPDWDPHARKTFLHGMAVRLNARLSAMRAERHGMTATGTSLIVVKDALVTEQFAATNLRLKKGSQGKIKLGSDDAYNAGKAAGDKVHLGGGVGNDAQSKRIG
jgi:hypothetical protein